MEILCKMANSISVKKINIATLLFSSSGGGRGRSTVSVGLQSLPISRRLQSEWALIMETKCKYDGTFTEDQFCVAAEALIGRWNEISLSQPSWSWNPCSTWCATAPSRDDQIGEEVCDAVEETNDTATLVLDVNEDIDTYDFHILNSFSCRVPVIYFCGSRHGWAALHLEKNLPLYSIEILRKSKWTYITQEEHPFLHRPWYMLHPCETSEWMKLLFGYTESEIPEVSNTYHHGYL